MPTRTTVELETEDQVGLLYRVSKVFAEFDIDLSYAKILTEKGAAMDTFYVKNAQGKKITAPKEQQRLRKALIRALDSHRQPTGP